jgi:SAM-dependent methyltransferase
MKDTAFRKAAGILSKSFFLKSGAELWRNNQTNWYFPLSKFQKILTGIYLILHDYSEGRFPPIYANREITYRGEILYGEDLPGISKSTFDIDEVRKPFLNFQACRKFLSAFTTMVGSFEKHGIRPPGRLLEIGCGSGWTAELLAIIGYQVLGTNLLPQSIELARRRISSLEAKGLSFGLDYKVAPMESVADVLDEKGSFDGVYVYEALHHAFAWREALQSVYESLKPGGYLFIFDEPNAVHTLSSYRVGRLSNTHEIGFWPGEMKRYLKKIGFSNIHHLKAQYHFYCRPFSLVAQRPLEERS